MTLSAAPSLPAIPGTTRVRFRLPAKAGATLVRAVVWPCVDGRGRPAGYIAQSADHDVASDGATPEWALARLRRCLGSTYRRAGRPVTVAATAAPAADHVRAAYAAAPEFGEAPR